MKIRKTAKRESSKLSFTCWLWKCFYYDWIWEKHIWAGNKPTRNQFLFIFFSRMAWNGAWFKLHKCQFCPRFAAETAAFPLRWQWSCLIVFISPSAQRLLYWDDFSQAGCAIFPVHDYRSFWQSWDVLPHQAFTTHQRCWQQSLLHMSLWLEEGQSWKGPELMFCILLNLRISFAWVCVSVELHS